MNTYVEDRLVVIASLAFIVAIFGFGLINATHVEHQTCTVTDKDRTRGSEGSSDARIYTKDCGTLHVGDSWLEWTFNSADTYGQIERGKTYEVKTRGFRVPFFSMFPNVVEVKQL